MKVISASATLAIVLVLFNTGCSSGNSSNQDNVTPTVSEVPEVQTDIELFAAPIDQMTPFSNQFDDARLSEVSGVQRSGLSDVVYYVHNDSDNEPVVYVTDAQASVLGSIRIAGVQATDWEAIAGARLNGIAHIVIGDIGNNNLPPNDLRLQIVEEPDFSNLNMGFNIEVNSREVGVSYADGSSPDAEALFIDGDNDTVIVVTKNEQNTTEQSIWRGSLSTGLSEGDLVLEFFGLVPLADQPLTNAITDIDIHPDGRQIALLTYGSISSGNIFIWNAGSNEGTVDALTRQADTTLAVPFIGSNVQAEGLSYSADGMHLLVGAEGLFTSTLAVLSVPAQ